MTKQKRSSGGGEEERKGGFSKANYPLHKGEEKGKAWEGKKKKRPKGPN